MKYTEEFDYEDEHVRCKLCSKRYKMNSRYGHYRSMRDHIKRHKKGNYSPTRIWCSYCYSSCTKYHLPGCEEKRKFYVDGIGKPLWEYSKNISNYKVAFDRYESYKKRVFEEGTRWAVYLVFEAEQNLVKRVLYVGQTARGSTRWVEHLNSKRFSKFNSLSFTWLEENVSKQVANAVELAMGLLLISNSKKKITNVRFDHSLVAIHEELLENKKQLDAADRFKQSAQTMFKACSVLVCNALLNTKNWTTLPKLRNGNNDMADLEELSCSMNSEMSGVDFIFQELLDEVRQAIAQSMPSEGSQPRKRHRYRRVVIEESEDEEISLQPDTGFGDQSDFVDTIDFGELGGATSSAMLTKDESSDNESMVPNPRCNQVDIAETENAANEVEDAPMAQTADGVPIVCLRSDEQPRVQSVELEAESVIAQPVATSNELQNEFADADESVLAGAPMFMFSTSVDVVEETIFEQVSIESLTPLQIGETAAEKNIQIQKAKKGLESMGLEQSDSELDENLPDQRAKEGTDGKPAKEKRAKKTDNNHHKTERPTQNKVCTGLADNGVENMGEVLWSLNSAPSTSSVGKPASDRGNFRGAPALTGGEEEMMAKPVKVSVCKFVDVNFIYENFPEDLEDLGFFS